MFKIFFATLYLTIAFLVFFQVKSELGNPIVLVPTLLVLGAAIWHVFNVIRGEHKIDTTYAET